IGNSEDLVDGLPINGVAVSVADFGSDLRYPVVGVFYSNFGLDPSGSTPDLSQPISSVLSPVTNASHVFEFVPVALPAAMIAPGTAVVNAVVGLPPGDSGLLGVGADSTRSPGGRSAFTYDGYATPAITLTFLDWGINPGQDNSSTSSCEPAARLPHGRLRVSG